MMTPYHPTIPMPSPTGIDEGVDQNGEKLPVTYYSALTNEVKYVIIFYRTQ